MIKKISFAKRNQKMMQHDYDDDRYYFVKYIEHDGEHCGPCRYVILKTSCPFFGLLEKDRINGKLKRHKRCLESEE
jgi:hypothetical protein